MCRKLAVAATALIAASLASMVQAADSSAATSAAAASAKAAAPAPAPAPPRKASPQERAAAERLEPLARAAFWAREADIDPTDVVAGVRLAAALRALQQYDEAAASAERVLVVDPNNFEALLEDARDRVAQGQGFYAIAPAQHAQAMTPKDWRPLSLLGVAYTQVRREDDAQAAWKAALALSPDNPAVLSNIAMSMASKGDAAGAEALLRKAVAQPSASLQVRQNLTLILGIEGKLAEAEAMMRQNLPPEEADANLAYLKAVSTGHDAIVPTAPDSHGWTAVKGAGS
jgi:Flp pilus assembly protein TadD